MASDDAYAFRFEGVEYRIPKLMLAEARAMQRVTGKTILEIGQGIAKGDVECFDALIWVARKRTEPTLKFEDVDGDLNSFEWVDDDEAGEQAGGAEGNGPDPTVTQRLDPIGPSTPHDAL